MQSVAWPSYEDFVADGFRESEVVTATMFARMQGKPSPQPYQLRDPEMKVEGIGAVLRDKLQGLWTQSQKQLLLIQSGCFETVRTLCQQESIDRDKFLEQHGEKPGKDEKESWERFIRVYYGRAILELDTTVSSDQLQQLVAAWLKRSDDLVASGGDVLKWQALECIDCAIDLLHLRPSASQNQMLVNAYTKRGEVLYHFDAPECQEAAEASFDEAIRLNREKTAPNDDERDERYRLIVEAYDSIHRSRTVPVVVNQVSPPLAKRVHRLTRPDDFPLAPLVFQPQATPLAGEEWQSTLTRMKLSPNRMVAPPNREIRPPEDTPHTKKALVPWISTCVVGIGLMALTAWKYTESALFGGAERLPAIDARAFSDEPTEVLSKFMNARSWQELLPLVRHPEVIRPLMADWYATRPLTPSPKYRVVNVNDGALDSADGNGLGERWVNLMSVQRTPLEAPYTIFMEFTPDGYRIDWESAVRYQATDWQTFVESKRTESTNFRVHVAKDDYFNYQFNDSTVWASYKIRDPHTEQVINGYAHQQSEVARLLDRFADLQGWVPVILTLKYSPEHPESDAVEIVSLLQKEWLVDYEPNQIHFDRGGNWPALSAREASPETHLPKL